MKWNEVQLPCPNCGETCSFTTADCYYISPIICHTCHALLQINYDDDWNLIVIDLADDLVES